MLVSGRADMRREAREESFEQQASCRSLSWDVKRCEDETYELDLEMEAFE